jgi:hypothetical protein
MKRSIAALLLSAAALIALIFVLRDPSRSPLPGSGATALSAPAAPDAAPPPPHEEPPPSATQLSRQLAVLLTEFRTLAGDSAGLARRVGLLRETKRVALSAEPSAAATVIVAALKAGDDAATGLGFVVGVGATLSEAPSYRTALIDLLGQVDPHAAAAHARTFLRDPAVTSDEYAIALRNLAHGPRAEFPLAEIRGAFSSMLSREDWRSQPTAGFLEAFDAAVETSAFTELVPLIVHTGAAPESPVIRAAFIAADRVMLSDPATVIATFRSDPDALASAPYHRASLLSRLDVRDPSQRALLEAYLLRADHAPGEVDYFLEVFPNGNAFVGRTLVTRGSVSGPDMGAVSRLDEATAAVVRSWMSSPDFSLRQDALRRVLDRLEKTSLPSP